MAKHATLSPSAAKRWLNCPGSICLSAGLPAQKPSIHAAEGTVAHGLAEKYLTNGDEFGLITSKGMTVKQDGFEILVSEEMLDGVKLYWNTVKECRAELEKVSKPAPVLYGVEKRVQAVSVDPRLWGTVDSFLYRPGDVLYVLDYKFGRTEIDPRENPQLISYAIGIMDAFAGWAFNHVVLLIVQPRAGGVKRWITDIPQLREYAAYMKKIAAITEEPDAPLKVGDWCRWCPVAVAGCPELAKKATELACVEFDAVSPDTTLLPNTALLSIEKLGAALEWRDVLTDWFDAIEERVRTELMSGKEIPGWKLVEGRANRKWVDEKEVEKRLGKVLGEKLFERKMLGPAKVEKMVGKELVSELAYRPEVPKTIAPESDPRPAARNSAKDDFEAVELLPQKAAIKPQ